MREPVQYLTGEDRGANRAMKGVLEALALDLKARGALDVREAFIDGSFAQRHAGYTIHRRGSCPDAGRPKVLLLQLTPRQS
jgi:hypothetical protein